MALPYQSSLVIHKQSEKSGIRQGVAQILSQALLARKQPNLNKLGDGCGTFAVGKQVSGANRPEGGSVDPFPFIIE